MGFTCAVFFFNDIDVGACHNVRECIETFNISFESTQNKQQYGTKIICTGARKKLW